MKRILFSIITTLVIVFCNNTPVKQETNTDLRAKADTTLSFKGIVLGEPIDSTLVDSIGDGEVTLINGDVEYKMTGPCVFDHINGSSKKPGAAEHIVLYTNESQPLSLMPQVALYEEAYGDFSYLKTDQLQSGLISNMVMGELNNGKPIVRKDIIDSFFKSAMFVKNNPHNQISLSFVWEWKNKSIIIRYDPFNDISANTYVEYVHKGYAQRMESIKEEKQRKDSLEKAEVERKKLIKKTQDI